MAAATLHARRVPALALLLLAALPLPAGAQLGPTGTQYWDQNSPGMPVAMEAGAQFGFALAAGDFDCDGFDDLAIGMPGEDLVGAVNGGRLIVLYADESGPTTVDPQVWGQNSPVLQDSAEANDRFSSVLAAGDFDNDGCADLVIGIPQEDIGADLDAGAVSVIYGDEDGLTGDGDDFWHQDLATIDESAEPGDRFGGALAVGDFDDDGFADLAIGASSEDVGATADAGTIHILWGSIFGLVAGESLTLARGNGLAGTPQTGERLGAALAAADFNALFPGDDLAVGAPGLDVNGEDQAGGLLIVSNLGGTIFNSTYTAASAGVPGAPEDFDRFGSVLAGGDFDGDGLIELAVGVPEEDLEGPPLLGSAGAVVILDFDGDPMQLWLQDDLPPEQSELNDQFGGALAAADFDADGIDDLAIGAPLEDLGPVLGGGIVHILYGSPGEGLTAAGAETWLQTINPVEIGDEFGGVLVTGRFAGHSGSDLAIGVPAETIGAFAETGAVNVIFSRALFLDSFESGDTDAWSAVGP